MFVDVITNVFSIYGCYR